LVKFWGVFLEMLAEVVKYHFDGSLAAARASSNSSRIACRSVFVVEASMVIIALP